MLRGVLREAAADGTAGGGNTGAGEGAGSSAGADASAGAGATAPQLDPKALQAEIERLRAESAEKENAIRYWHEQAKGGSKQPEKTTAADEPESDDILELISKKGVKGLDEILAKRGFVRAEDVEVRINQRATQIAIENELAAKYPDLKDSKSEFFQETAKHYGILLKDGVPAHLAMKLAAERAELDGFKTGKRQTQQEREEREARARAQAGDRGRSTAAHEPENDDLDAFQKYLCDAMEITPEQYKKRAKEGVRISGRVQ
jgi:hypothetical protein